MNFRWLTVLVAGTLGPSAALAQGVPAADLAKAHQTATRACAACHGADGNSTLAPNPALAGQHAEYTLKQLTNFRPRDDKPAERPNAVMAGMVANLSVDDLRDLAAYFETQKPVPRMARDADLVKLGRSILFGKQHQLHVRSERSQSSADIEHGSWSQVHIQKGNGAAFFIGADNCLTFAFHDIGGHKFRELVIPFCVGMSTTGHKFIESLL